METLQSFTAKFAEALSSLQPEDSTLKWDFRGEIGDTILFERTLIGIVQYTMSTEEIYGNRTQRLEGSLTGEIMVD